MYAWNSQNPLYEGPRTAEVRWKWWQLFLLKARSADSFERRYWHDDGGPDSTQFGLKEMAPFITEQGEGEYFPFVKGEVTPPFVAVIKQLPLHYPTESNAPFWDLHLFDGSRRGFTSGDFGTVVFVRLTDADTRQLELHGFDRTEFERVNDF